MQYILNLFQHNYFHLFHTCIVWWRLRELHVFPDVVDCSKNIIIHKIKKAIWTENFFDSKNICTLYFKEQNLQEETGWKMAKKQEYYKNRRPTWVQQTTLFENYHFSLSFSLLLSFSTTNDKYKSFFSFKNLFSSLMFPGDKIDVA